MPTLVNDEITPNASFLQIEAASSELELNLIINKIIQNNYELFHGCTFTPSEAELLRSYKTLLTLPTEESEISMEDAKKLQSVIQSIETERDGVENNFLDSISSTNLKAVDIIKNKAEKYKQLLVKSEISRLRFVDLDEKNYSNLMYTASTFFSFVTVGATIASAIPGANLIVHPIKFASEFMRYATTSAAYREDASISLENKQAVIEHYESLKNYKIGEASVSVGGTALLGVSLIVPILAPIGAGLIFIGNVFAVEAANKELNHERQYGIGIGHQDRIDALNARVSSTRANAFGSANIILGSLAIIGVFVFPPAGLALGIVAGIATGISAVSAIYSAKKVDDERTFLNNASAKQDLSIDDTIKNGNYINQLNEVAQGLHAREQVSLEMRAATLNQKSKESKIVPEKNEQSAKTTMTTQYEASANNNNPKINIQKETTQPNEPVKPFPIKELPNRP